MIRARTDRKLLVGVVYHFVWSQILIKVKHDVLFSVFCNNLRLSVHSAHSRTNLHPVVDPNVFGRHCNLAHLVLAERRDVLNETEHN